LEIRLDSIDTDKKEAETDQENGKKLEHEWMGLSIFLFHEPREWPTLKWKSS
jgi:hypothetical protein